VLSSSLPACLRFANIRANQYAAQHFAHGRRAETGSERAVEDLESRFERVGLLKNGLDAVQRLAHAGDGRLAQQRLE